MFNLDSLSMSDTTTLALKHPVTEELLYSNADKTEVASILLFGTGSKQYRGGVTALQNRALKRGKKVATAEQLREEGVELLVACSSEATNFTYAGKPVNDEASFRALYSDPKFGWLKEQVDAALGDVSNFLPSL